MGKIKQLFKSGLAARILVPSGLLTVIVIAVMTYLSYQYSSQAMINALDNESVQRMEELHEVLSTNLDRYQNIADVLEKNIQEKTNNSGVVSTMDNLLGSDKHLMSVYFGQTDGKFIANKGTNTPADYDPRKRPFYQSASALKPGEYYWSDVYKDAFTGQKIMTLSKPVYENSKLLGVVGIDLDLGFIADIIKQVKLGQTGFATLLDRNGIFVYHPDNNLMDKDASNENYYLQTVGKKSGIVHYDANGNAKTFAFSRTDRTGWVIAGDVMDSDIKAVASTVVKPLLIVALFAIIIASIVMIPIISSAITPLILLVRKMKEVEQGDLTVNLDLKRKDEIGLVANTFNNMVENLKEIIGKLKDTSQNVASTAEELSASAEESAKSLEEVSSSIQQVSASTENQTFTVGNVLDDAEQIKSHIQEIHDRNVKILAIIKDAKLQTAEGADIVAELVSHIEQIKTMSEFILQSTMNLESKSSNINDIVDIIKGIADQTNLLSLNAGIEAARAGEHGRGFAVVANEVRKLAEQSKNATNDISTLISEIQDNVKQVVVSVENGAGKISDGVRKGNEVGSKFSEIKNQVDTIDQTFLSKLPIMEKIHNSAGDIVKSLENTKRQSDEVAAGAEEIAAATEQQLASMEEVSSVSNSLSNMADELQEAITRFKI
ncbi:methyl-accepting chemotaxis protein [Paenibacillus sp. KN14-4R]|uniref:methyl-accepting chemotaxis protein n=1 Tax=Paenibacillus sp. KN14-4R TaxID=3445773 RepID=UPI003FA11130